jgi:hypothetical protein
VAAGSAAGTRGGVVLACWRRGLLLAGEAESRVGAVVWLQPCPANLATVTIHRTGTALAMASGPNYLAGSNKVTVVKQHGLEPREFSFGNVPLFGAGCQHFEPNALHAVIDTATDNIRVCLAAHFPPVIVLPGQPC